VYTRYTRTNHQHGTIRDLPASTGQKGGANLQGRKPAKQRVFFCEDGLLCPLWRALTRGAMGQARHNGHNAYRCTAAERACTCGARYRVVPESLLMPDLNNIMASVTLPDDVRAEAVSLLQDMDTIGATDKQRDKLEAELKRINRMYQGGNMADDDYDRETARIKAEISLLARSANVNEAIDVDAAIEVLDDMAALWSEATQQEKAEIVKSLFDAFNVDLDERKLHSFKPKKRYAALTKAAYTKAEVTGFEASPDVKIGFMGQSHLHSWQAMALVQCIVVASRVDLIHFNTLGPERNVKTKLRRKV